MPELPEVQALAESLNESLRGAVVQDVVIRSVAALKTYDPPVDALRGLSITGVHRVGKFIDFEAGPLHLVVHLARAGWLRLRAQPTNARPSLRGPLIMVLTLGDHRALEATEQGTEKRLAIYLVRDLQQVAGIARLGVDALAEDLTVTGLGDLLRRQAGTLKNVLADQAVIAGIGNAYSDEILHAARLSPFRKASGLDPDEVARLHVEMRAVLTDAVTRARTANPAELRGDKKVRMRVHGRTGERCPECGDVIREVSYTSRSFQYCATCQTRGKVHADRRLSRLLR
jgi:formamidopyrimidine-DNA glycosylase